MTDIILKQIYDGVRDPSWPDIDYWDDFLNLDDRIQKECIEQHHIDIHYKKCTDPSAVRIIQNGNFYQKDRFVFVCIEKCASTHYTDFFVTRLGWQKVDYKDIKDNKEIVLFGMMLNPIERYLKGLTQWLWDKKVYRQYDLKEFMSNALIPDVHSLPYSLMLPFDLDKVHWVPLNHFSSEQTKVCINDLFGFYGSDLRVPTEHPPMYVSDSEKSALFAQIKKIWQEEIHNRYMIYFLYAQDLHFYKNMIDNFRRDWSHIMLEEVDRYK